MPGIEHGTSWLAVKDLTNCADLAPWYNSEVNCFVSLCRCTIWDAGHRSGCAHALWHSRHPYQHALHASTWQFDPTGLGCAGTFWPWRKGGNENLARKLSKQQRNQVGFSSYQHLRLKQFTALSYAYTVCDTQVCAHTMKWNSLIITLSFVTVLSNS